MGGKVLLADVSFVLEPGRFIALLGPNGAGKTTLMRTILGLLTLQAGTISVFGAPPSRGDRRTGYLPQARAANPSFLRGRDLVEVAAGAWPFGGRAGRAEVARVLRQVGAHDIADVPLASLSGGQRQRLMLAQSLLGQPRLLLLDEPLISLDVPSQRATVELAATLCRDHGVTVLFSAHEITPLIDHIDQVLYLGQGEAALGSVEDVITGPVLSRLYGGPVEVVRAAGRIFVVSGDDPVRGHVSDRC